MRGRQAAVLRINSGLDCDCSVSGVQLPRAPGLISRSERWRLVCVAKRRIPQAARYCRSAALVSVGCRRPISRTEDSWTSGYACLAELGFFGLGTCALWPFRDKLYAADRIFYGVQDRTGRGCGRANCACICVNLPGGEVAGAMRFAVRVKF